jgi:4-hydroxy-3-methylbut-2-enyl diphosphate reductase
MFCSLSSFGLLKSTSSFIGGDRGALVSRSGRRQGQVGAPLYAVAEPPVDKKQRRRQIMQSEKFNRRGFASTKEEAQGLMVGEFSSELLKELRESAYVLERGGLTVLLAKAYGFCWGVERAVALAYEARRQFPDHRIWITNEIIHNPKVNTRLKEMGICFVPEHVDDQGMRHKDLSGIAPTDVVILPAFGATLEEMNYLDQLGCQIVDTTCPWVSKVWNALDKHQRARCTSIIHGKWNHEETIATASFAETYLILRDMAEAEYVCDYILHGGDKSAFLTKFRHAMSKDFDPDRDLDAVGIANQTTMMKNETAAIGKLFERTMMRKFGATELSKHFVAFNTICDATQERQDAMLELVEHELDLILVVGGFNSSNTSHLLEIAHHRGIPAYHVDTAERIGPGNRIEYRDVDGQIRQAEHWLPKVGKNGKHVRLGVTSGASTPDRYVEECLDRVFLIHALMQNQPAS